MGYMTSSKVKYLKPQNSKTRPFPKPRPVTGALGLWGAGIGWFKSPDDGALDSKEQGLVCISQVWFMMLAMMNV